MKTSWVWMTDDVNSSCVKDVFRDFFYSTLGDKALGVSFLKKSYTTRSHMLGLLVLSLNPTDTIILFSLVAADRQVCDYRPTSKAHRYYIPIPPLIVSILRCQPVISEMTNSEEDVGGVTFPRLSNNSF